MEHWEMGEENQENADKSCPSAFQQQIQAFALWACAPLAMALSLALSRDEEKTRAA